MYSFVDPPYALFSSFFSSERMQFRRKTAVEIDLKALECVRRWQRTRKTSRKSVAELARSVRMNLAKLRSILRRGLGRRLGSLTKTEKIQEAVRKKRVKSIDAHRIVRPRFSHRTTARLTKKIRTAKKKAAIMLKARRRVKPQEHHVYDTAASQESSQRLRAFSSRW